MEITQFSKIKEETKLIITILSVFVLIVAGYAVNSVLVLLAWLLLIGIILFSHSAEDTLIPYIMIVTWGAEIWGVIGARSYTIIKLLTLFLFLFRAIRSQNKGKNQICIDKQFFLFYALFSLYVFAGIMVCNTGDVGTGINLVLCYLVIYYAVSIVDYSFYRKASLALALGVVLSAGLFYIAPNVPRLQYVVNQMIQTTNIYGANSLTRLSAMAYDPNQYGLYVIIALTVLLRCLFLEGFRNRVMIFLCVILSILGVLTLSKSYLIIFVFLFVLFSYRLLSATNIRTNYKLLIISLLIIVGALSINSLGTYIDAFIERFMVSSANDLTTGRTTIWARYIDIIFNNISVLFFGTSISYSLPNYSSPHNFILYMIFHFGILGSLIYVCMIVGILREAKKMYLIKTDANINITYRFVPLIIYLMYSMTIDPFLLYDAKIALLVPAFISAKYLYMNE